MAERREGYSEPHHRRGNNGPRNVSDPRTEVFGSSYSIYHDGIAVGRAITCSLGKVAARHPFITTAPVTAYLYWRLVR